MRKICQTCVQLNKQTNKENLKEEGVFSGFLTSVSYRSNTGKERKKKPRDKTGGKLLTLTIFDLQLCSLQQKLRFEEPVNEK